MTSRAGEWRFQHRKSTGVTTVNAAAAAAAVFAAADASIDAINSCQ
jgi:hypothetical protein